MLLLALAACPAAAAARAPAPVSVPLHFEPNVGQAPDNVAFVGRGASGTFLLASDTVTLLKTGVRARLQLAGARAGVRGEAIDKQPGVSNYFRGRDPSRWRRGVPHYAKVRFREVWEGVDVVYYGTPEKLEHDFIVAPGAGPQRVRLRWSGGRPRLDADGGVTLEAGAWSWTLDKPLVYQEIDGGRRLIPARYVVSRRGEIGFALGAYDRSRPLIIDPILRISTFLGGSGDDKPAALVSDAQGNTYLTGTTTSTNFPTAFPVDSTLGGDQDAFITKFAFNGSPLLFSTFIGGSSKDAGAGIGLDPQGRVYVGGWTESIDFPLVNPYKDRFEGLVESFIVRLDPTGTFLQYSTIFGGRNREYITALAVDRAGAVYFTGYTTSPEYPVTPGAYQTQGRIEGLTAFLTKMVPAAFDSLALGYSTFFYGSATEFILALAVDGAGNAYIAGQTDSFDFPTTPDAVQRNFAGPTEGFVTKFNAAGSGLLYSTLLGSIGTDTVYGLGVDEFGRAVATGVTGSFFPGFPVTPNAFDTTRKSYEDAFVTMFNSTGTSLIYSTFLGGTAYEVGRSVKVNAGGYAFVTGFTESLTFPVTPDATQLYKTVLADAFLTVFNPAGTGLSFSTFLGGNNYDAGNVVALDGSGNAYVAGETLSNDFPTVFDSLDRTYNGGFDAFLSKYIDFNLQGCIAQVATPFTAFPAAGGGNVISVNAPGGCAWWAQRSTDMPSTDSSWSGTGLGAVTYTVGANSAALPRTSAITVAGNVVPIIQRGTGATAPFEDVPLAHPNADFITLMKQNGVTSGCTPTAYCPDATTTRGEMAVFIIRSLLRSDTFPFPATPYFTDVPANHPYFKYIQKMRELGITTGCTAATYCPNDPVTRGQMSVFVMRARIGNEFRFGSSPYFSDVPTTHPYFNFIQKMKETGVTTGCGGGQYCANDLTTRSQMAVFLIRAFYTPW